ncbi:DUF2782 domain-containing protein [Luteimonas huabeiensis]|uniref:DUF2782 domain-containing protein n=1 Tax=Luteimonas huabeiensis TaxID=1244513 RepID=UPI0004ACB2BD|nr:DUF2782 domain-containing protein [Luteimonas huabeiensis]
MNARVPAGPLLLSCLLPALLLAGCATSPALDRPQGLPPDAVEATRVEPNGDTITEYRVAGQLRAVRIQSARGPVYYLYDRDGDGSLDRGEGDDPPQTYYKLFEWD